MYVASLFVLSAGLTVDDVEIFEINEAFASQVRRYIYY